MSTVPLGDMWGGSGDSVRDPDGLEEELLCSEASGDEALLPRPAVGLGEEMTGETVGDAAGEAVGDAAGETVGDAAGEAAGDSEELTEDDKKRVGVVGAVEGDEDVGEVRALRRF